MKRSSEKNGEIDFEFIENFISALKNLTIKDIITYADNKIKATEKFILSEK